MNRILEKLAEATINQLDSQIVSNEIAVVWIRGFPLSKLQ